ncbi:FAD:protein FMN transferase [Prosthecomicrobium sp. N25]|uniref:FAD:protein FMN transferase n=1 Tax=Prosthecomicrobium sp. N25 TaxID=3129254 RepID=UPI0030778EB8
MSTDLADPPEVLVRHALNGPTMGARWTAVLYAPTNLETTGLRAALQAAVDRVDDQMSTWKPRSDLSRLNAAPVGRWIDLPQELATVLDAALAVGTASQGAFDIGVGDLVRAWGFGAGAGDPDPIAAAEVARRRPVAAPQTLEIDRTRRRARKHAPLRLDLSGIAKGFGVDELGRVMAASGAGSWLVGIDGEMLARGTKPNGRPWAIAHERPREGIREIAGVLDLADCAVATSGSYRHLRETAAGRIGHTMDPRSNAPAASDLVSVTVLAPRCMDADAWATAILVSGSAAGAALVRRLGLRVLAVGRDGQVSWLGEPEHGDDGQAPSSGR